MNERRLDKLLPSLDPPLSDEEEGAVRAIAEIMDEREFFIVGSDRSGGIFHLTFSDDQAQLTYSVGELVELAQKLSDKVPFPWDDELKRQGYP